MAGDLTFYTNPMSRGRIVRWMLEEVGHAYETVLLDYATTMKEPAYLAINPMGKVPAIRHGDTVVTEAAAICAYLADMYPDAGLAPPPGNPKRGPYYRWFFFAAGPLESAIITAALGAQVPPEKQAMVGWGSMELALDAVEKAVSASPFLCGDRFTAADLYLGAQLGFGMMFGTIGKRPAFEDYVGRTAGRPASVRAKEIDDALIAEQKKQQGG
jgi:glutathione S-transferase